MFMHFNTCDYADYRRTKNILYTHWSKTIVIEKPVALHEYMDEPLVN